MSYDFMMSIYAHMPIIRSLDNLAIIPIGRMRGTSANVRAARHCPGLVCLFKLFHGMATVHGDREEVSST